MVINVSEALDSDTSESITVTRIDDNTGVYTDGLWVSGTTTTFKTLCSVQQPSGKELQVLPMGERSKEIIKLISKKPLRMTDIENNIQADVVTTKSKKYKIIYAEDWNAYGHTTALGARVLE